MSLGYEVGQTTSRIVTFDIDSVRKFATMAGDMSPLHHNEEFARTTMFGGLIVSGTQYAALMMGMVATFMTERKVSVGLEFEFQFRKAVPVGETVRLEWSIVTIEPSPKLKGDVINLAGSLINKGGDVCVLAKSKCLLIGDIRQPGSRVE